jgi:putative hydrolase of the HAD superfamily
MIRAVVLDFGNVICRFDIRVVVERFARNSGKPVREVEELLHTHVDVFKRYETGLITSHEFYKQVAHMCGLHMTEAEFIRAYTDKFTPIKETIELIRQLKGKCLLGLLSNTSEWDFEYGIKPQEVLPMFDVVTLSFRVHSMKPATEMYHELLAKLNVAPHQVLYFDDIRENVQAGRSLGMQAVLFTAPEDAIRAVRATGLLPEYVFVK